MSSNGAPAIIQDTFHRKNYKTICVLGKGGFAVVYQVTDMYSQEQFACKLTPKQKLSKKKFFEKFTSEVKIHRQLQHPYIVRVSNVFKDTINYYMLMELCDQGTLSDLNRRRSKGMCEEEVQRLTWELAQAYLYMKEHRVVHRDMKSANVFMTTTQCADIGPDAKAITCKVGDFGLSVQLENNDEKHFTLCGTPNFLPPETIVSHVFKRIKINRECDQNIDAECQDLCKNLVNRLSTQAQGRSNYSAMDQGHSYPSDMWSLGCIVYSLFYGRPPFEATNIQSTYKKIVRGEFTYPQKPGLFITDAAKSFIDQCLRTDPNDRMTIEQAIKHEWLGEGQHVKLKYLPIQSADAAFNPNSFKNELSQFCNFQCTIAERIQQTRDGIVTKEPTVVQKKIEKQPSLAIIQENPMVEQPVKTIQAPQPVITAPAPVSTTIQTYLNRRFARYDFINYQLIPPSPLKYTPVLQYFDVKADQISHDSIAEFRKTLEEQQNTVFNEYDWWAKFIRDNANQEVDELMHIHQHVYTLSWIDFSNRYGFAYQLSNGCVGVLFNDMSIVVLSPNLKYVDYIDLINYKNYQRNATQINNNEPQTEYPDKQQVMLRMKFSHVKDFLHDKKYKLILYFKEYLENRSIQPLPSEKKDSTDLFVGKYFDYIYDESCLIYAHSVTEEQVLKSYDQRQGVISKLAQTGQMQPVGNQPSFAVKMVQCKIYDQVVNELLSQYVTKLHTKHGKDSMFSCDEITQHIQQRFQAILMYPQTYIKRYHLNEQIGTLCILYNSKVFQVNFPDHIKIIIAHKTVSILNSKRELLVYPSLYLKHVDFRFEELRLRIQESRRLYELVRRTRFE
ncbi:Serine/threonine-protein_kinase PLK [Hexamita inflata]|uniref:Serine/threonine-protein kinase PLK n=1 Tax=Hexamita inflata TaxID=28002 RepID=A0AA86TUF1_9EUKA|nr:Serine/threonine-protein kinase PLK [Hexamita inflata]